VDGPRILPDSSSYWSDASSESRNQNISYAIQEIAAPKLSTQTDLCQDESAAPIEFTCFG
jgi:hypothetical protein